MNRMAFYDRMMSKIIPRSTVRKVVDDARWFGVKKVVFTNGCFDVFHEGHAVTLAFAKDQGDILVVGLNSDGSVRRLKGADRPVMDEQRRATVLAATMFVDYVVIFDEDTPLNLIKTIKPDVLVKGGDYADKKVVGVDEVESWGGRVAFAPYKAGASSSKTIEMIKGVR